MDDENYEVKLSSDDSAESEGDEEEELKNITKTMLHCKFPDCSRVFKKQALLLEHNMAHMGERPYSCDDCDKSYRRPYHLRRHMLSAHTAKSEFPCPNDGCLYVTNVKCDLTKHIRRNHETVPFQCSFDGCDNTFKKHKLLYIHECEHRGEKPYKCTVEGCGKAYQFNTALKKHTQIHNKERAYFCKNEDCDSMFYTWSELRKHVYSCKVYKCEECGKIFKLPGMLKSHKAIHDSERVLYKCPMEGCDREYVKQSNVVQHLKAFHQAEKTFKCTDEKCGQSFAHKRSLKRHLENHERILQTYERIARNKKKKEKKRRKQKRLLASTASKVSGFIHELGQFVNESDMGRPTNAESDAVNLTTTEDESDLERIVKPATVISVNDKVSGKMEISDIIDASKYALLSDKEISSDSDIQSTLLSGV